MYLRLFVCHLSYTQILFQILALSFISFFYPLLAELKLAHVIPNLALVI